MVSLSARLRPAYSTEVRAVAGGFRVAVAECECTAQSPGDGNLV